MNAQDAFDGVLTTSAMFIDRLERRMAMLGENSIDIDQIHEIQSVIEDCEIFFDTVDFTNVSFMGIGCFAETAKDWMKGKLYASSSLQESQV